MIDGSGTANDSGIYRNQRSLGAGRGRCYFYFVTVNLVKGKPPAVLAAPSDWIAAYDNNRDRGGLRGLAVSSARVLSGGSVRDYTTRIDEDRLEVQPTIAPILRSDVTGGYLFSSEARNVLNSREGEEAYATLLRRIELLGEMQVDTTVKLVEHVNKAEEYPLTSDQKAGIVRKCQLLQTMYRFCLDLNDPSKRITYLGSCAEKALEQCRPVIAYTPKRYKTLLDWNIYFRKTEQFPHPNPHVEYGKECMPKIFRMYPEAKGLFNEFATKAICKELLSPRYMQDVMQTELIPRLYQLYLDDFQKAKVQEGLAQDNGDALSLGSDDSDREMIDSEQDNHPPDYSFEFAFLDADTEDTERDEEIDDDELSVVSGTTTAMAALEEQPLNKEEFLTMLGLKTVHETTVLRWMKFLGYTFDGRRKCYYCDGHENPEQQEYRRKFIRTYLSYEIRSYRWVQITKQQAEALEADLKQPLMKGISPYSWIENDVQENETEWREYHVDCHPRLFEFVSNENKNFGGDLSCRKPNEARPIIFIGQDECVFSQYSFSSKTWKGPKGESKLVPKSEGESLMISGFQSRVFGLGLGREITNDEHQQINARRNLPEYNEYLSAEAAMELNGTVKKEDLPKSDPFLRKFELGKDKDGYWNYFRMSLQLEDVVDCLVILYPDCDFVFLFDQSSGHAKKRKDGLNAAVMNVQWGGKQPLMRPTVLVEGCLGLHQAQIQLGKEQSMVFTDQDAGPFNMSADERENRKRDRPKAGNKRKKKHKTIDELMSEFKQYPDFRPNNVRYRQAEAFAEARRLGIPIESNEQEIERGWLGKPKGLLQVLWERGFIDEEKVNQQHYYKKQCDDPDRSLVTMLQKCTDFQNEKSAMEALCDDMSSMDTSAAPGQPSRQIILLTTPKYHCEIAGDGIEYSWGLSKRGFRRLALAQKRGKGNFHEAVKQCLSLVKVEHARRFSARTRRYMLIYGNLDKLPKEGEEDSTLSYGEIEKYVKTKFKTHRNTLDQESAYLSQIWKESQSLFSL
jgi:hypothetical protein